MIFHTHKVACKKNDEFKLIPLADWHLGERGHCSRQLEEFLQEHDNPNTLYLGNGDLLSCITPGDPRYDKAIDISQHADIIDWQVDECVKIMTPLQGTIIGLGEGNHELNYRKKKGHTNVIRRVCDQIGVPFLGYSALIEIVFEFPRGGSNILRIYQHHGFGSATSTLGGCVNKYKRRMYNFDSNIAMYAHDHQLFARMFPQISWNNRENGKWLVLCGAFMKTYEDSEEASYGEKAGYDPLVIGAPVLKIRPGKKWELGGII